MLLEFSLIAFFILIGLVFVTSLLLLPQALKKLGIVPKKFNPVKAEPYECGLETIGPTWTQFNVRYYFYALLLITFDITVIFVYPWALELNNLGPGSLVAIFGFLGILAVGYIHAWRKGALEWK